MRLKTSHGAYIVPGPGGVLLQRPTPIDLGHGSVSESLRLHVPLSENAEIAINDGPLAPSVAVALDNVSIALRRDQAYLCADPTRPDLRFDRERVGEWERFVLESEENEYANPSWNELPTVDKQRPVVIDSLAGYQILTYSGAAIPITWPDFSDKSITRHSIPDGSWIVDVDCTSNPKEPLLAFWFYPFSDRIHVWRLNGKGQRTGGYDLPLAEIRSFLLSRRALGLPFTVRLYMLCQRLGDMVGATLLGPDIFAAAEAGSIEALYLVLSDYQSHAWEKVKPLAARALHVLHAANHAWIEEAEQHDRRITVEVLGRALGALAPKLGGDLPDRLQDEFDFHDVFASPKHLPSREQALPLALRRHTIASLEQVIGIKPNGEILGVILRPATRSIQIHYADGGIRGRTLDAVRYAYYAMSTHQDLVWDQLNQTDPSANAWMIYVETGDLPYIGSSVAFERYVGDNRLTLVPDVYYFGFRGFTDNWFKGEIPAWSEKKTGFVWRGSTTGAFNITADTFEQAPRVRLCEAGRRIGPPVDFGITNVVQARSEADEHEVRAALQRKGLWRENMPQHVMARYRFVLEIDGNANSWGFFPKLLMGSCILKVDSPYEQWFYKDLQPWVHYVPIANDLSDLDDRVQWCLLNEDICREIAMAGQRFAQERNFETQMKAAAGAYLSVARPI